MRTKFSKMLAATGLVTLDPEDHAQDDTPAEAYSEPEPQPEPERAPAPVAAPLPVLAPEQSVVAEQKDFADLYREANVPVVAYTAEKLLKLMAGLESMPMEVRKQAVRAMDEADDSWTVDDSVLDAQRKVKALAIAKQKIAQQVASALQNADREIAAIQAEEQDKSAQVRKQIAELTALLDRGVARAAQQMADVRAAAKTNQEAGDRESARLDAEMNRLGQIVITFSGGSPIQK
jgi:dGTP triphosphohydrolase